MLQLHYKAVVRDSEIMCECDLVTV